MSRKHNFNVTSGFIKKISRIALGTMLLGAGISHLSFGRKTFQAQVPDWVPMNKDLVVVLSGLVEITLGLSIIFWVKRRVFWGWAAAIFFALIFPGNIAQFTDHRDAFGLDTDLKRGIRLLFQPILIVWVLWCTGAWIHAKRKK